MTYGECKTQANAHLAPAAIVNTTEEEYEALKTWWTSPHPMLEGGEPYMAIFEEPLRELVVAAAEHDGPLP